MSVDVARNGQTVRMMMRRLTNRGGERRVTHGRHGGQGQGSPWEEAQTRRVHSVETNGEVQRGDGDRINERVCAVVVTDVDDGPGRDGRGSRCDLRVHGFKQRHTVRNEFSGSKVSSVIIQFPDFNF